MSGNRLRWLVWMALLVGGWTLLLDAHDALAELGREAQAARTRRERELAATQGVDWTAEAVRARAAQLAWLDHFVEADTPGLMRVSALEYVKALCDDAKAGCRVALVGEGEDAAAAPRGASAQASRGDGTRPKGVRAVQVSAAFNFTPASLLRLLRQIETGDRLCAVDHLLISGARAELQLRVFTVDAGEARSVRAGVAANDAPKGAGS